MKYMIKIIGATLPMVLIMTLSPVQSMEMTLSHIMAESGIILDFSEKPDVSSPPRAVPGTTHATHTVPTPLRDQLRFELAESGHTLNFWTGDDTVEPAPPPPRHVAKPYLETPAPSAGTPYHTRHTFVMAESGHTIVFYDRSTASPEVVNPDVRASK